MVLPLSLVYGISKSNSGDLGLAACNVLATGKSGSSPDLGRSWGDAAVLISSSRTWACRSGSIDHLTNPLGRKEPRGSLKFLAKDGLVLRSR